MTRLFPQTREQAEQHVLDYASGINSAALRPPGELTAKHLWWPDQKFSIIHILELPALPSMAKWRPSGEGRPQRKTL